MWFLREVSSFWKVSFIVSKRPFISKKEPVVGSSVLFSKIGTFVSSFSWTVLLPFDWFLALELLDFLLSFEESVD